jgi:membrane protease YdiL (CAAX protease family)
MAIVLAAALEVLYLERHSHKLMQAVGYLFAVWLCAFITDIVVNIHPKPAIGFPIKRSATREVCIILGCTLFGLIGLIIHFNPSVHALRGLEKLALFALILFFTYPIALALIYFFCYRYKPKELGSNLHYWYLPLLIHPIWGSITLAVASQESHWHAYIQQNGLIVGVLFTGLITAALPEEFIRLLLQTRLGILFHNKGMGFVVATFIWASLHIPVNFSQNPKEGLIYVIVSSWVIVPIGLLWGYLTHRTKSLLPAILVHGLNLWGLQNFKF